MRAHIILLISVMLLVAPSAAALSPDYVWVEADTACEGLLPGVVPSFEEQGCHSSTSRDIDPQGTFLWVRATVKIPDRMLEGNTPLGLFLSAKASSRVYLNGVPLGQNGRPAIKAEDEIPGKIDAVFLLPPAGLKPGENQIVFALSSHHGLLHLGTPIQVVAIGPYADPSVIALKGYLPSFLPLGILVIGTLYFGILAIRQRAGWTPFLPPLAALFAIAQLAAELSRGMVSYYYPFHDVRLLLITLFAALSGLSLLAHTVWRFVPDRKWTVVFAGLGLTALTIYFARSFDSKAAYALMTPTGVAAMIAASAAIRGHSSAVTYAVALTIAAAAINYTRSSFLDVYYYYVVAALLVFLFVQQVSQFIKAEQQRQAEEARADRLALALEEAQQKQRPSALAVRSGPVTEKIPTDQLVYCQGARDYVELMVLGSAPKLHTASLSELESELPATFLRVHRSYIVNMAFIDRLERDASGSGILYLTTGETVPVSRRIMPAVRKALA